MKVTVKWDPNYAGGKLTETYNGVLSFIHDPAYAMVFTIEGRTEPVTLFVGTFLSYTVEMEDDDPGYRHVHEDEGPRHECPVCHGSGILNEREVGEEGYDASFKMGSEMDEHRTHIQSVLELTTFDDRHPNHQCRINKRGLTCIKDDCDGEFISWADKIKEGSFE